MDSAVFNYYLFFILFYLFFQIGVRLAYEGFIDFFDFIPKICYNYCNVLLFSESNR